MELDDPVAIASRFGSIGPSTALGRAIAVRLLFCRSVREAVKACWTRSQKNARKVKQAYWKYISQTVRVILPMSNLHKPHVFCLVIATIILWIRKSSSRVRIESDIAYRRNFWKKSLKSADTYDEWTRVAALLEKEDPRRNDSALIYQEDLIKAKLMELRLRRESGEVLDTVLFRTDLLRKLQKDGLQVPLLVQEYLDEVCHHLTAVTDSKDLMLGEKLSFIREMRHAFGRTALLLSGGAALGTFHIGVVRTLIEHQLLPRIVAGASAGSITSSFIATRTLPELQSFFLENMPTMQFTDPSDGVFTIVDRILTRGVVHDIRQLQLLLRKLTFNLTFQEAYEKTGRVLAISVCSVRRHEPSRCLDHLTSPHVVIWSAVTASCAFPGIFEAQELMVKDRHGRLAPYHTPVEVDDRAEKCSSTRSRHWRDGSLKSDLPMSHLKELFNVRYFIVSQANPHTAPILRFKNAVRAYAGNFAAKLAHLFEMEVKHRCKQILEIGFPFCSLIKVFAQDWEGDLTIVMPVTFAQVAKLIQNPTPIDLKESANLGRRCTWEKLCAIKANCKIELMLDQCMSQLNQLHKLGKG